MEVIGQYEYSVRDLIGHGAFAVVFKGRHRVDHSLQVAIKSITKKNLARSQSLLGKEIKILEELTELHHQNVVALLDCKETQHHVYLVMEYCNGGDLADYLQSKGTLSEDTIRIFLKQIAGAMKALNAKGIVHRDLKPQNILLCHDSPKPNPLPTEIKLKIADFGFARFLEDGVMAATLCGSPMYMAPEVIMSLKYDAKADLWSIATIVFQCLTGKAPFQASTPQALKTFYEKTPNLAPKIPSGTSPELTNLLLRLLRRNAKDRMEFDDFFDHPFLRSVATKAVPVLQSSGRSPSSSPLQSPVSYGSPNITPLVPHSPKVGDDFPSTPSSSGSSDQVEDFVMVTADANSNNVLTRTPSPKHRATKRAFKPKGSPLASMPPEPLPVPTQREAFERIQRSCGSNYSSIGVNAGSSDSATENINSMATSPPTTPKSSHKSSPLKKQNSNTSLCSTGSTGSRSRLAANISQLSPPTVHFVIGTPPGTGSSVSVNNSRRCSAPVINNRQTPPLYRQMTPPAYAIAATSPLLPAICANPNTGAQVLRPIVGSTPQEYTYYQQPSTPWILRQSKTEPSITNLNVANSATRLAFGPSSPRALTYNELNEYNRQNSSPKLSQSNPYHCYVYPYNNSFGNPLSSPTHVTHPQNEQIMFEAPDLPEETLLDREHNETLAKLNYILALVECILELAEIKSSPLSVLTDSTNKEMQSEWYRKTEQLVLYVRSLQLLSSALQLSRKEIQSGRLKTSTSVRSVLRTMKDRFHHCLNTCKSLDCASLITNSCTQKALENISADKLIYNYAIEMCQSAALEELFGHPTECFRRYQTAQILLHSLSIQVNNENDKKLLNRYKEAVEKRLFCITRL